MTNDIRNIIKNSELFWSLTNEQADILASIATKKTFYAGEYIFTEGEPFPKICIIYEGKVSLEMEIRIGSRTKRRAIIDVLGANSCFGWSTFLNQPASLSGIALEPSKLLVLEVEQVRHLFIHDMEMGYKVMHEIVNLVSSRLTSARGTLAHVLSVTSHDLRAPLATVQSTIDAVVSGFAGEINQKQKDLLLGGKRRVIGLLEMIDNILDISYIELKATDFHKVDLYQVIEASIGDVSGNAKAKSIVLRNDAAKSLSPVLGAEKRLQQVLTNLLSNGIKFTPKGGLVTVTSRETSGRVQIDVSDTGIGVSPEDQPKLFSEFFRGGTIEAEGAGLGLSISKKIVEGHGGTIWVQSPDPETNQGTRFSFALPKVLEAAVVQDETERRAFTGADILVVDDDPEMRQVMALMLESQGYKVRTAQDGEDALAKIDEKEPDLLILDLLLPKLDGFEVCKRIKDKKGKGGKKFPIIVHSAVKEESSRRRYELETKSGLDIDDYITKPSSPPLLLQRVKKALQLQKPAGTMSFTRFK